jgi:hypothetical protein
MGLSAEKEAELPPLLFLSKYNNMPRQISYLRNNRQVT